MFFFTTPKTDSRSRTRISRVMAYRDRGLVAKQDADDLDQDDQEESVGHQAVHDDPVGLEGLYPVLCCRPGHDEDDERHHLGTVVRVGELMNRY